MTMANILVRPDEMMAAMDSPEASAEYIRQLGESLVVAAGKMGVTLRIDRAPLQPLAMGNVRHVVEAWPSRQGPDQHAAPRPPKA